MIGCPQYVILLWFLAVLQQRDRTRWINLIPPKYRNLPVSETLADGFEAGAASVVCWKLPFFSPGIILGEAKAGQQGIHHMVNMCHVRVRKRINNIKFIGQLLVFCSKSLFSIAIDQKIVKEDLWITSMTFPTFPPFCRKSLKYRRCACSGPLSDFGSQVDSAEWRWITFFTRPFYLKKFPKSGVKNPMHCCIVFVHIVSWWWPPCLWLVAKSGLNSLNVTNCTSSAGSRVSTRVWLMKGHDCWVSVSGRYLSAHKEKLAATCKSRNTYATWLWLCLLQALNFE